MALYDNKHWLLSNIRNTFITSDDSGMCEAVMVCDNIARQIPVGKYDCYPGIEQDEDEDDIDALAHSFEFDLNSDLQFGLRRHRSNTAQRLEKLEEEKKKSANTIHIKWINNPNPLSDEDREELFPRKDIEMVRREFNLNPRVSTLTEVLTKFPNMPQNPFKEYAKMDGNAQVGIPTKKYLIFVTMFPEEKRKYPMEVVVIATAKVLDFIGLICWKCFIEHTDIVLKDDITKYGLFIAEDDGDVDWDFPCLDSKEVIGKFGFKYLAIVEKDQVKKNHDESYPIMIEAPLEEEASSSVGANKRAQILMEDELTRLKGCTTALEATQSFNVYILNKVRAKTEVDIEVSCDKLEICPVLHSYGSSRNLTVKFWNRQRVESNSMENVVSCDLTEHKSNNRSTFRLVYYKIRRENGNGETGKFKTKDFECITSVATEIVNKVNHILEVRQSERRREYIALRERKAHRRKNFHLGPR